MPFQKTVNSGLAKAIPGMPYSLAADVQTVKFAGAGGVTVGRFCWLKDEDSVVTNGTGAPLGLVVLTHYESSIEGGAEASMHILEDDPASIAVKGERFVICTNEAAAGDLVFAKQTDGSISAGTGEAPEGFAATGWKVAQGGAAGELIAISAWR